MVNTSTLMVPPLKEQAVVNKYFAKKWNDVKEYSGMMICYKTVCVKRNSSETNDCEKNGVQRICEVRMKVKMVMGTDCCSNTVADPEFPRGGGANPKGGRQPIIWPIFPENCMKMDHTWRRWSPRYGLCNTTLSCSTCF